MFCIGNSHIGCVLLAAQERRVALDIVVLKGIPAFVTLAQPVTVHEPDELGPDVLERVAAARRVFAFVGGIDHQSLGLGEHPQPFDVVLPELPRLPLAPEAEIIPVDAMVEVLKRRASVALRTLRHIAEAALGPVYQFASPPPPSPAWLAKQEAWLDALKRAYANGARGSALVTLIESLGMRHERFVRYKLWRLSSQIYSEAAGELGVRLVSLPDAVVDGEGFLRPEFCGDPIHANAAYGALVLAQMESIA
jgi:hypothetical protein